RRAAQPPVASPSPSASSGPSSSCPPIGPTRPGVGGWCSANRSRPGPERWASSAFVRSAAFFFAHARIFVSPSLMSVLLERRPPRFPDHAHHPRAPAPRRLVGRGRPPLLCLLSQPPKSSTHAPPPCPPPPRTPAAAPPVSLRAPATAAGRRPRWPRRARTPP